MPIGAVPSGSPGEILYVVDVGYEEIIRQPIADKVFSELCHHHYDVVHNAMKTLAGRSVVDISVVKSCTQSLRDGIKVHCHERGIEAVQAEYPDFKPGDPMPDAMARTYYQGVVQGFRDCQVGLTGLHAMGMLPMEDYARIANGVRHEARLYTREHMADQKLRKALERRDLATYGNKDGPTFDSLYEKHIGGGKTPEQAYRAIVESATRTNAIVNAYITVTKGFSKIAAMFREYSEDRFNIGGPWMG